ncbi:MAG TPA: hypothetical protein VGM62_19360, partial [Chthoniobacterales bacterium]
MRGIAKKARQQAGHAKRFAVRKLKQLTDSHEKVISLKSRNGSKGDVLLSYFTEFFLLPAGQPPPTNTHSRYWESLLMGQTFVDLGYNVDVIYHTNQTFAPNKDYRMFVDVRHNLERLAPVLPKDCIKIGHIDVCHILFQNVAEWKRLLEL